MRLWHQRLLPYLDRQRLLGQHRECCALRGKGWGKKHATVDYIFTHRRDYLVAYHYLVMSEMKRRGYNPDETWYNGDYRGSTLGIEQGCCNLKGVRSILINTSIGGEPIYPEHNDDYLRECINLLKEKNAPIDWEKVKVELGLEYIS